MLNTARKYLFFVFKKIIPPNWIRKAIEQAHIEAISQQCTRAEGVLLHPDSRVINFQHDPSKITIGKNSVIRGELQVNAYGGKITIGDYTYVGEDSRVWSGEGISIGNSVQISHNVNIIDCNTHSLDYEERHNEFLDVIQKGSIQSRGNIASAPIIIEDHAWISFNAVILKGVTIGKGAIVAANSVVTKNVEPFTMVAGIPATVIKTL